MSIQLILQIHLEKAHALKKLSDAKLIRILSRAIADAASSASLTSVGMRKGKKLDVELKSFSIEEKKNEREGVKSVKKGNTTAELLCKQH